MDEGPSRLPDEREPPLRRRLGPCRATVQPCGNRGPRSMRRLPSDLQSIATFRTLPETRKCRPCCPAGEVVRLPLRHKARHGSSIPAMACRRRGDAARRRRPHSGFRRRVCCWDGDFRDAGGVRTPCSRTQIVDTGECESPVDRLADMPAPGSTAHSMGLYNSSADVHHFRTVLEKPPEGFQPQRWRFFYARSSARRGQAPGEVLLSPILMSIELTLQKESIESQVQAIGESVLCWRSDCAPERTEQWPIRTVWKSSSRSNISAGPR